MTALSALVNYTPSLAPGMERYPCSSLTAYRGSLIGRSSAGLAVRWTGTVGETFIGIAQENVVGASTILVDTREQVIKGTNGFETGINVTGSTAATNNGAEVWCADDDLATSTLSSATANSIGTVEKWISGALCWIRVRPLSVRAATVPASLKVLDAGSDNVITFASATNESADRTLTIPPMGANDSLALLGQANAFTAQQTTTRGVSSGTAAKIGGLYYSQTTASTVITNTAAETVFDQGVFSIPANTLTAGSILRVRYQGTVVAANSTDTLAIKLLLGGSTTNTTGTALMTSATLDMTTADIFAGEFVLVARAAPGATAACVGVGSQVIGPVASATTKGAFMASTNIATNGALPVKVSATMSAAHTGNQLRLDVFNVEVIG